jgi:hypothetical protein
MRCRGSLQEWERSGLDEDSHGGPRRGVERGKRSSVLAYPVSPHPQRAHTFCPLESGATSEVAGLWSRLKLKARQLTELRLAVLAMLAKQRGVERERGDRPANTTPAM